MTWLLRALALAWALVALWLYPKDRGIAVVFAILAGLGWAASGDYRGPRRRR